MDRKTVLLDEAQLERQREYTRQLAALHQQRGKPVYALVDTFGCQQNVADSQHILGMLRDMGCQFTDDAAQADIVVLNTCAIRDHAEKRVYGNLGALTHTKSRTRSRSSACADAWPSGRKWRRRCARAIATWSGVRAAGAVEVPGASVPGLHPAGACVLRGG